MARPPSRLRSSEDVGDLLPAAKIQRTAGEGIVKKAIPSVLENVPSELVGDIVSRLPSSDVFTLRTVCKEWNAEVIPSAVGNCKSGLLLFPSTFMGRRQQIQSNDVWCTLFKNAKDHTKVTRVTIFAESFQQGCYDSLSLAACQKGLLFFLLSFQGAAMKIVVLNPLTGKSKGLSLPDHLRHDLVNKGQDIVIVGVVVDSSTGNYKMVVAGRPCQQKIMIDGQVYMRPTYKTFLYDSMHGTWAIDGPLLSEILPSIGRKLCRVLYRRSFVCTGDVYWFTTDEVPGEVPVSCSNFIVKFDMLENRWSTILVHCTRNIKNCELVGICNFQAAVHRDEIYLFHPHVHPLHGCHVLLVGSEEREDDISDCKVQQKDDSHPQVRSIPKDMVNDLNTFFTWYESSSNNRLATQELTLAAKPVDFFAFGEQGLFVHVIKIAEHKDEKLRFLIQDVKGKTITILPVVKKSLIRGEIESQGCRSFDELNPANVWMFAGSFFSTP